MCMCIYYTKKEAYTHTHMRAQTHIYIYIYISKNICLQAITNDDEHSITLKNYKRIMHKI